MATDSVFQNTWIRGPLFDFTWILNGPFLGLLCLLASPWLSPVFLALLVGITVQRAHLFAPVFLAWARPDFRALMMKEKMRYLWIPFAALLIGTVTGFAGGYYGRSYGWAARLPFVLLVIFSFWNTYHYAAQNYGVLTIYRKRLGADDAGRRRIDRLFCNFIMLVPIPMLILVAKANPPLLSVSLWRIPLSDRVADVIRLVSIAISLVAVTAMIIRELSGTPRSSPARVVLVLQVGLAAVVGFWQPFFYFGMVAMSHYFASVGIAFHVFDRHRRRALPAERSGWPLLVAAAGLFLLSIPFCNPFYRFLTLVTTPHLALLPGPFEPLLLSTLTGISIGEGFLHNLYDRHVYKLSRKEVRDTIGLDL